MVEVGTACQHGLSRFYFLKTSEIGGPYIVCKIAISLDNIRKILQTMDIFFKVTRVLHVIYTSIKYMKC